VEHRVKASDDDSGSNDPAQWQHEVGCLVLLASLGAERTERRGVLVELELVLKVLIPRGAQLTEQQRKEE
jgi:hypothetical protein